MTRPACDICGGRINTADETRCWRHRGAYRGAITRSRSRPKDRVDPATWAAVRARDGDMCVGPRAGFEGPCGGPLEMDHVLNGGGLSIRGPSVVGNLVVLCRDHHRFKTEHAAVCRRLLLAFLGVARPAPER